MFLQFFYYSPNIISTLTINASMYFSNKSMWCNCLKPPIQGVNVKFKNFPILAMFLANDFPK